jgi:hypothetical protein
MAVINAKAADEWTEKDIAQAPYDLRRVEGPAYTGHILMVFRMLCESVFTSDFLYRMYIGKNQLPQVGRRARARARGRGGPGGGGGQRLLRRRRPLSPSGAELY